MDRITEPESPQTAYQRLLQTPGFIADPAQAEVVDLLDRLHHDLLNATQPTGGFWRRWLGGGTEVTPVRGLYLYGGVGRGKTLLVDLFFHSLPAGMGVRIHFHAFMRGIHRELRELKSLADPLTEVARHYRERCRVLCLDEFHVGDITDAMILGNLLRSLFERGVTVLATSNEAPESLYRDGLQRDRFLPAIALIREHMDVHLVESATDYRLRTLEQAEIFHVSDDAEVAGLERYFTELAPDGDSVSHSVEIEGRPIPTVRHGDGIIWFEFDAICGGPRGAADYIEIARCYQTVMVSQIPVMDDMSNDAARRFITMIDEFYDRKVKLICSAAAEPAALYRGQRLAQPFARTASRLIEMQSREYLRAAHSSD
ncbi:MAG: cell division protein ZapE [Gammaproteobacteria bacterium]|nr:cell division protein ZapE [Gammaproteobacteria bacterium]